MSDCGDIISYLEESSKAWEEKEYLKATISAYWCIQYCRHGEPYSMSKEELYNIESQAWKIYKKASKNFHSAILSKTTFIYGTICPKLLWLYKNKYTSRQISEKTQKKFDMGHNIGYLAQKLFPNGIDASIFDAEHIIDMSPISLPFNLKQQLWIDRTQQLYENNTVYEAAFVNDDVFAAVDILEKTNTGHIAYEVKASTCITETFLRDCALQFYVINKNCKLDDFFLIYIDETYLNTVQIPLEEINSTNVDINRLFIIESVLTRILPWQEYISDKIKFCKSILKRGEPKIAMGEQCTNPYECMFKHYCGHNALNDFGIW